MTSTTTRPARPAGTGRGPSLRHAEPALLAGGRAGAAASLLGLALVVLPVLVVWWGEDRSDTGALDTLRSGAHLWLVAHGVLLDLPGGRLGLPPLGLSLLPAWLCWRAGRRAAVASRSEIPRDALRAAGGVALLYAGVAFVVAAAATGDGASPVLWTTLAGPVLLAGAAAAAGALRALPAGRRPELPARAGAAVCGAMAATLLLVAAGALLVGVTLALELGSAADVAAAAEPGAVGGLGLLALGACLAPNAAVWGASWLAGPGFALGVGTSVSPFDVVLGPVPALPLLTALPQAAPPIAVLVLALAVPVTAGVLAGWAFCSARASRGQAVLDAAATGLLAGVLLAGLAALSGGPLGGERLAVVGPSPWQVGAAVAAQVAVGAAVGTALRRRRA